MTDETVKRAEETIRAMDDYLDRWMQPPMWCPNFIVAQNSVAPLGYVPDVYRWYSLEELIP